jgi:aquaporin Z
MFNPRTDVKKYVAEAFGTLVLVFGGVGSAVLAGEEIGTFGISFAFGLALLAMVYAIGPISGCNINPAVTLGLLLTRKLGPRDAAMYVVAQVIGAIVAAGLVLLIAEGMPDGYDASSEGLGANGYDDHSPNGFDLRAGFIAEVVLTFFLVFTVLGATDIKAPVGFAGIAIGLVLTLIHLVGIPVTGTSVNPARSIGPAVFVGDWALSQLWLFIVAPFIGSAVAVGAYLLVRDAAPLISAEEAEQALAQEQVERTSGVVDAEQALRDEQRERGQRPP